MARTDETVKAATARALKKMRTDRELTKSEIARRANTSYQQVDRWETAASTPSVSNLYALAAAYEADFTDVALAIDKAKRAMRGGSEDGDSHEEG